MAKPKLTVKQFAILSLGQLTPPWHLGKLLKTYNRYSISLKESISALSETQAVVYVRIGDYAQFSQAWTAAIGPEPLSQQTWTNLLKQAFSAGSSPTQPKKDTLVKLSDALSPSSICSAAEGSIVFVSNDETTAGIAGTYGNLVNAIAAIVPATAPNGIIETGCDGSAVLLGPLSGEEGATLVLGANPFSATEPASQNNPVGLFGIYISDKQNNSPAADNIDIIQLVAQHMQVICNTIVNLLLDTISKQASEGILNALAAAVEDLNAYLAWLSFLENVTFTNKNPLPSGTKISLEFDGPFTIPEIIFQPTDASQPPIIISKFTLQPDGTSTGGTVSQ